MSKQGVWLAALYSYKCPRSKNLGFHQMLLDFVLNKKNQELVEQQLQKLLSFAYYKIIASQNNINDVFDERVVRAYWTGDDELVRSIESNTNILLPFHNFTALDAIHRTPNPDPDNCRISVARVKEAGEAVISVYHRPLIQKGDKFFLADKSEIKKIKRGFIGEVIRETWVTYHRGIGREILEEEDAIVLKRRTEEAIELFNEQQNQNPVN